MCKAVTECCYLYVGKPGRTETALMEIFTFYAEVCSSNGYGTNG